MPSEKVVQALSFEAVISPLRIPQFIESYWGRAPVYIAGPRDKFLNLFSMDRLEQCLRRASGDSLEIQRAIASRAVHVRASLKRGCDLFEVRPSDAMTVYNSGATICIDGMNLLDETIADLVVGTQNELKFLGTVDCRAYMSPHGQGFEMHFDRRIATTLQIEGRKKWRFSREVALQWPHYQCSVLSPDPQAEQRQEWERIKPASTCTFDEVVLEPGDVLCLPAGCWHAAEASGFSLALNLAFGARGGILSVLTPTIQKLVMMSPQWRGPFHPASGGVGRNRFIEEYRERIKELIEVLESVYNSPDVLQEAWTLLSSGKKTEVEGIPRASD